MTELTSAIIDAVGGDPTARTSIASLNTSVAQILARLQALEAFKPVTISKWAYEDDFEDAAVGTNLATRPNLTLTGASPTTYKISSAKGAYNAELYKGSTYIQFGPSMDDSFGWEIEVDENRSGVPGNGRTDAWSATAQGLRIAYKDADNNISLFRDGRFGIERSKVAGTETYQGKAFDHGLTTAPAFVSETNPASRKVKYRYHNGEFRVRGPNQEYLYRASRLAYPYSAIMVNELTGLSDVATRLGALVYESATWIYDFMNGYRMRPLKMVITSHARYCSRRPNSAGTAPLDYGRIWIKGDYKGTAMRWVYRLNSLPAPKTVAQDWRACDDVVTSNGTFSLNCQIPVGGPYEIELAMTDSDGVTHNDYTRRIACGKVFIGNGQSNSTGRQDQASGLTVYGQKAAAAAYTSVTNSENMPAYEIAGLGTLEHSFPRVIEGSRVYSDGSGIPCLMVATGAAATPAAGVFNDTNHAKFEAVVARYDGWIDGVFWDQGEADRDGATANANYFNTFDAGYQKMIVSTGNPTLPMWISPIGRYASTSAPGADKGYTWTQIDRQSINIFDAYQAMIDKYPGRVAYSDSKLAQRHQGADAYHYSAAAYQSMMRRLARTILKSEGRSVPDGRGPLVTGVTRSGATLTLALDMNGATGLTDLISLTTVDNDVAGTPAFQGLYGYQVSTDNFATTVAISSIVVNAARTALVITLAADPGAAVKVRSFFGASYDDRQLFWGTYAGGYEDVPIFPIYKPLTSN